MAEPIEEFDIPLFVPWSAGREQLNLLADHTAHLADLERRADAATSLEELEELQDAYRALKADAQKTSLRWHAARKDLRSWYRTHRRPCSRGCGNRAARGRGKCDACRKAEERSRREAELRADLLRLDDLDRVVHERAELTSSLMQLDRGAPAGAGRARLSQHLARPAGAPRPQSKLATSRLQRWM